MILPNRSEKIRVGVIGAGFISQVAHLHSLTRSSKCEISAIADARPLLCKEVAQSFAIPSVYSHYEEMLKGEKLDAVIVCLARSCLSAVVEHVLSFGLPVLSEKPMAHTVADAEKLVLLSERKGVEYYLGFMRRCDEGVHSFKDRMNALIVEKTYGEIIHASMLDFCGEYAVKIPHHLRSEEKPAFRYPEWQKLPERFPLEWSKDYEYSMNVLIHDVNLLRYLFGNHLMPQSFQVNPGLSQTAVLATPNFCITLSAGRAKLGKWDQVLHVYFEKGRLSLYLPSPLSRQESAFIEEISEGKRYTHFPLGKAWAFESQMDQFLAGVKGKDKLSSSGRDSLKDIEMLENLWKLKR